MLSDKDPPSYSAQAATLVLGERNAAYGNPADDYKKTARIWSGLLAHKLKPDAEITPLDAVIMMVGLKLSREMNQHKDDNLIDAHGYLICAEWLVKGEKPKG